MLDRSGLKKYSNPSWFKQNMMAGSRVTSISWSGGVPLRLDRTKNCRTAKDAGSGISSLIYNFCLMSIG